ncbi:D-2-hydroxyacid dehydrogenase [Prauserella cavernicola]|uniref:D-2-hydroxyacid dehydrogenase n=1 Tax=Prauserella cavernicola TaxID=2800127 RepID=A0A934QVT9_9PSEU|nr:D-2-hydroxyacid dehydrogenase [Prauserella cavernicola]MBK1787476.1 D-2-hydroxyacid dehydrogenase [Prauserella cavernicola]
MTTPPDDRPLVLVTGPVTVDQVHQIARAAPSRQIRRVTTRAELAEHLAAAEVLATPAEEVPTALLRHARRLRWVHLWAAGADAALSPELVEHSATLTSSKGHGAVPLAEHALMLMLMLSRDAPRWLRAQRLRRWEPFAHGELNGLTVGIIGLGNSGSDLARKAKAFHMTVLGMRRGTVRPDGVDELFPVSRLGEMLSLSDFVVVTAPRTPETVGLLGEPEFRRMRRTAHFVCISRGGVADDAALLRALREGWIAGAGIDAHGVEPLPPDSPFWDLPNVILTPHNGTSRSETRQRGVDVFCQNLGRHVEGHPLVNLIDKQTGY